jgi:hypothetical protein
MSRFLEFVSQHMAGRVAVSGRLAALSSVLALLVASRVAAAEVDDRVTLGYLASPPIAASARGVSHAMMLRWDARAWRPWLELGVGIEAGVSGGRESLTRFAVLPGVALVKPVGDFELRLEQQIGWQVVHGRITLGGIPLRGTETRSFHQELAVALDAPLTEVVDLRVRGGMVVDGIYPPGYSSTRVGPFVAIAFVVKP